MKQISISVTILAAMFSLALSSCAQVEPEDMTDFEQQAFEDWVEKYINKGTPNSVAVKQDNGSYVEFLADGDQSIPSSADGPAWLMLDFTSRDHRGNVFATRSEEEALRQRTFNPYIYYAPLFVHIADDGTGIPEGQFHVLKNKLKKRDGSEIKLTEGTAIRLYMPSYMAYGTTGFSGGMGYGGQYPLGATNIVVDSIAVKEVVKDPALKEGRLVEEHVATWGLEARDSLMWHLYVDSVNFTPKQAMLDEYPNMELKKEYALTADSTVQIRYVGRFLPSAGYPEGFIFDTNIGSVYNEFYNRRSAERYFAVATELPTWYYTASSQKDSFLSAFYNFIPVARRGRWYRLVFTSEYGYDSEGRASESVTTSSGGSRLATEIPPYTPLVFEIYIELEKK
jgi:hypothetical protein